QSGIPLEFGLIRNHYVGRTFIEPSQSIRHFGVKIKLNAQREVLDRKRVIVVDDSIVRGTTSRKIIRMLRDAGAREVHMRISSPATIGPCYYGIDTPTRSELIASSSSVEEIRRFIEADSLAYLSREGMYAHFNGRGEGFCDACFTGNYPIHFEDEGHTRQLYLFDALNR
ncbi:MAG TPA: amidophosphoribosyltransferase, partial [Candidatus Eisenbacteria bacterium]|nr:amidophosphoribosyltransferase [Candidatus Eisenbacteria bacterium]